MKNEYDLSINKYKETEYKAIEYPPTREIMADIRELERQIGLQLDELEKLLDSEGAVPYSAKKED